MRLMKSLILLLSLPCILQSQQLVGGGVGRILYIPNRYEYTPIINLDCNYFLAMKHFAIKAGGDFIPNKEFGLKYNLSGSVGYTTKLDKPNSFYILFGLLKSNVTRHSHYSKDYQDYLHYWGKKSGVLTLGGIFKIGNSKHLVGGIELFVWNDKFYHERSRGYTNYYFPLTLSASLNYRFGDVVKPGSKIDSSQSYKLLGFGVGANLNSFKYYSSKGSLEFDYFYARRYFAAKLMAGFQPFTDFGLKSNFFGAIGITTKMQNVLSVHVLMGLNNINSSKPNYVKTDGEKLTIEPITQLQFSFGAYIRIPNHPQYAIGLEYFPWIEYFKSISQYGKTGYGQQNRMLSTSFNYVFKSKNIVPTHMRSKEKEMSRPLLLSGFAIGRNLTPTFYHRTVNIAMNCFWARRHFAVKAKTDFQPATSFGLINITSLCFGYTSDSKKTISFYLMGGMGLPTSQKKTYLNTNGLIHRYYNIVSLQLNSGIHYRLPKNDRIMLGFEYISSQESFQVNKKGQEYSSNNILMASLNYIILNNK